MGKSYGIKCEKCNYRFKVIIGRGRSFRLFKIAAVTEKLRFTNRDYVGNKYITDEKIISDINHILKTKKNVCEDVETYMQRESWRGSGSAQYLCTKCGRLYNNIYFRLLFTDGVYEPDYFCTKCQIILAQVEINCGNNEGGQFISCGKKINWSCPRCKHNKIIHDNTVRMRWFD